MKNSKKLFLIFLSVLIVAFVSCKKDSGGSITTPTPTFKPSSLIGDWETTKTGNKLTINNDGSAKATVNNTALNNIKKADNWDTDKDKEVQEFTLTHKITSTENSAAEGWTITYTFKNSNSCVSVYRKSTGEVVESGSATFTKKATAK